MRAHGPCAVFVLASAALLAGACNPPGGDYVVTIWPGRAARGELVAMPIATNVPPSSSTELYDLSRHNVTVLIDWGTGSTTVTKAANQGALRVIEVGAAPGALVFNWQPPAGRGWLAIAVFTIPLAVPSNLPFPVSATVRPLVNGQPIHPFVDEVMLEAALELVAGSPKIASVIPLSQDLEPPPLLRLAAVAAPDKFDPEWFSEEAIKLGSIELELDHPSLVPVDAYPNSEAAAGTAMVGPGSGPTRTRIVLVHPKGFGLPEDTPGQAGDGPFLDIAFPPAAKFLASEFTIRNLRVTDLDGVELIDAPLATSYFVRYARAQNP